MIAKVVSIYNYKDVSKSVPSVPHLSSLWVTEYEGVTCKIKYTITSTHVGYLNNVSHLGLNEPVGVNIIYLL